MGYPDVMLIFYTRYLKRPQDRKYEGKRKEETDFV